MRESGVDADHKLCASNQLCNLIQRCTIGDAGSWHGCGNEFTSYPLALRSPGQYQLIPLPKHFAKRDPIRVRPLLFGPCGRVQQKAVARCVLSDFRATDSKVGGPMRRIAERQTAQHSIALDSVQISVDAMTDIVKQRSKGFPNA